MYELTVNGEEIVLGADFAPRFSKTIITPNSPSSKSSEFSYSFSLPAVEQNARILGATPNLYEKNKFARRFEAVLHVGQTALFKGELYISEINQDGYKCNLVKTNRGASDLFGDKGLRDMDWVVMNATVDNIFANNLEINPDYILPLAAYGLLPKYQTSEQEGGVYLYTDKNVIDEYNYFSITDFPLSVNLKSAIRKVFEESGYKIGGSFMEDANTDRLFLSYSDSDTYIPYNWGNMARFQCHMHFQTEKYDSTATAYETTALWGEESQSLLIQDLLTNTEISGVQGNPETFYNYDEENGRQYFYVPADGNYAIHLEGSVTPQTNLPAGHSGGQFDTDHRYSDGQFWEWEPYKPISVPTGSPYTEGRLRGELQVHVCAAADRTPEAMTMLTNLRNPARTTGTIYPEQRNTLCVDPSEDESFVLGASFGYNMPSAGEDHQLWLAPTLAYSYLDAYDKTHDITQFNSIVWTECAPQKVGIRPGYNSERGNIVPATVGGALDGTGWYRINGQAVFIRKSGTPSSGYAYNSAFDIIWENEMVLKSGWSSDKSYSMDDFIHTLYQFPPLHGVQGEFGAYLRDYETPSYRYSANFTYGDGFFITGDEEPHDTEKIGEQGKTKTFCNNIIAYLRKGDRIYFDWVSDAQVSGSFLTTSAVDVEMDFGIRYINSDKNSIISSADQYQTSVREITPYEDVQDWDLNLARFLPDITVSQFLTDLSNLFNLNLNETMAGSYSLDYANYIADNGAVYELESRYADESYTITPLDIPYQYKLGFKINEKEEGFAPAYGDAEGGYTGSSDITTGNPNGTVYTKTTNISYCWYKTFFVGDTEILIPIISDNSVWAPDYIEGERNPRSYKTYADDIGKKFFNLPYRLWYKDEDVYEVMGHQFAKVSNTSGYDISFDRKIDNSLVNGCYYLIKKNSGFILERNMYLTPEDYNNFNPSTRIALGGDIYLPCSISSFDGLGEAYTAIKFIKV